MAKFLSKGFNLKRCFALLFLTIFWTVIAVIGGYVILLVFLTVPSGIAREAAEQGGLALWLWDGIKYLLLVLGVLILAAVSSEWIKIK